MTTESFPYVEHKVFTCDRPQAAQDRGRSAHICQRCEDPAVPESESGSERSRPPTLLTMLRRWMAVQAKGMRKWPRRLHDCSACRRSFSSFSLC
ncbi:hypothetical protein EYF80_019685 [Liparis tanakae]|uniref:Uncharacterized protein n=1 Tax=Liparis tanakae TaxID=230148 RepID=A0A4Z2HVZ1_9TELE|nr:hypothetical protein EYF80_019685 [Liparis tanakae]